MENNTSFTEEEKICVLEYVKTKKEICNIEKNLEDLYSELSTKMYELGHFGIFQIYNGKGFLIERIIVDRCKIEITYLETPFIQEDDKDEVPHELSSLANATLIIRDILIKNESIIEGKMSELQEVMKNHERFYCGGYLFIRNEDGFDVTLRRIIIPKE